MEIKAKASIHNEFLFEVRDAQTNELKQTAKAYNMVLNSMYTRLVNRNPYGGYIAFGGGSGTLDPNRTTLFNNIGSRSVTVVETVYDIFNNNSYKKFKIILQPEEFVGANITEIGLSYNGTNIVTHALIKDSQGNTISLNKTSTDIITIYATIYAQLVSDKPYIGFCNGNNNQLLKYLLNDTTSINTKIQIGQGDGENGPSVKSVNHLLAELDCVWTANAAEKKLQSSVVRFGTTVGNGPVNEIGLADIFRVKLPSPEVIAPITRTDVNIGTGDGAKTAFDIPQYYPKQDSIVVKVDGVATTAFSISKKTTRLGPRNIFYNASGTLNHIRMSPNAKFAAVVENNKLAIYKFDKDKCVITSACDVTKAEAQGYYAPYRDAGFRWSKNERILITRVTVAPYILVYAIDDDGNIEKRLPLPEGFVSGNNHMYDITGDGKWLVHFNMPYYVDYVSGAIDVYPIDLINLTIGARVSTIGGIPNFIYGGMSPDGFGVFARGYNATNFYSIAPGTGLIAALKTNADTYGTNDDWPAWSADRKLFAFRDTGWERTMCIGKLNPDTGTWTKVAQRFTSNYDFPMSAEFSPDNKWLAIKGDAGLIVLPTDSSSDTPLGAALSNVSNVLSGAGNYRGTMSFSEDSTYVFLNAHAWRLLPDTYTINFTEPVPVNSIVTVDYTLDYIPKDVNHVLDVSLSIQFGEGV